MARKLTTDDLDRMTGDDRWLGFGYLGERRNHLAEGRDVSAADHRALNEANAKALTYNELFEWANSKNGRWYGDCMFGANGQHAEQYLPGQPQR